MFSKCRNAARLLILATLTLVLLAARSSANEALLFELGSAAAEASLASYNNSAPTGWLRIHSEQMQSGLTWVLFQRVVNGRTQVILAFRGTDRNVSEDPVGVFKDLANNFWQPVVPV